MPLMQWDDSFSVGVKEIDGQHRKLVAMVNELNEAMLQAKGKEVLGGIIDGLINYTGTHFKTEETYFDKFLYPHAVSHTREHRDFVQKVGAFKADYARGKIGLSIEVMTFLSEWLKTHIKGSDKQYGPFFNKKGLI